MSLSELESPEFPDADLPENRYAMADELAWQLQNLEQTVRECEATIAAVLDRADRLGVYSIDGHRNIRSWAAANVRWSNRESLERARTVTLIRDVPELGDDLKYGEIGVAQVRELARARTSKRNRYRRWLLREERHFDDALWVAAMCVTGRANSDTVVHPGREVAAVESKLLALHPSTG